MRKPSGMLTPVGTDQWGVALPNWDEMGPHLSRDEFDNEELGSICPLAIAPAHFSRRIAAQQSQFTVFGREKNSLQKLMNIEEESNGVNCNCGQPHRSLVTFRIKAKAIDRIKEDLRLIGVSEVTAYPDLEGLGRDLDYSFKDFIQGSKGKPRL